MASSVPPPIDEKGGRLFVERRRRPGRRRLFGRRATDPTLTGEMRRDVPVTYLYLALIGCAVVLGALVLSMLG
jgi:hypothetical protein